MRPNLVIPYLLGNVWYFGIQAGLDFNSSPPTALLDGQTYTPLPNLWNEGTSTICDSSGALLMYSNGAKIWRRDQQVMENGDSLMGHPSSTHAALIVPRPGSSSYYYVFTTDASENAFANGVRYSVVDICLDNGFGGVLAEAKNVLLSNSMAEKLAAVRHANNEDCWVIGHGFNTNIFRAYRLTQAGIVDTVLSQVGPVDVLGWGGQIVLSPNGTQLAYAYPSTWGSLNLFDFDNATGIISNPRFHQNAIDDQSYGVGFSPDGTKLYVTTTNWGKVFQYDLSLASWAETIASRTQLAAENPDSWRDVKLGPDNKVYVSRAMRQYLARIENPNLAGIACQYVDQAIDLQGQQASFGLPTHVTAYNYSNTVASCAGPIGIEPLETGHPFIQYRGHGIVSVDQDAGAQYTSLLLFDAGGRRCGTYPLSSSGSTRIGFSSLANGVYHVVLTSGSASQLRSTFVVCDL
jgi:hypothetical protein